MSRRLADGLGVALHLREHRQQLRAPRGRSAARTTAPCAPASARAGARPADQVPWRRICRQPSGVPGTLEGVADRRARGRADLDGAARQRRARRDQREDVAAEAAADQARRRRTASAVADAPRRPAWRRRSGRAGRRGRRRGSGPSAARSPARSAATAASTRSFSPMTCSARERHGSSQRLGASALGPAQRVDAELLGRPRAHSRAAVVVGRAGVACAGRRRPRRRRQSPSATRHARRPCRSAKSIRSAAPARATSSAAYWSSSPVGAPTQSFSTREHTRGERAAVGVLDAGDAEQRERQRAAERRAGRQPAAARHVAA